MNEAPFGSHETSHTRRMSHEDRRKEKSEAFKNSRAEARQKARAKVRLQTPEVTKQLILAHKGSHQVIQKPTCIWITYSFPLLPFLSAFCWLKCMQLFCQQRVKHKVQATTCLGCNYKQFKRAVSFRTHLLWNTGGSTAALSAKPGTEEG